MRPPGAVLGPVAAIVFDCGDTLLRLDPPREAIVREAALEIGLDLPEKAIRRAYDQIDFAIACGALPSRMDPDREAHRRSLNRALCLALGIDGFLDRLHPVLLQRFAARRRWRAFEDAPAALAALAARAPLHVLANWDHGLEARLVEADIRRHFVTVVASQALALEKPDAACFAAFARITGVAAATALYVGNDYAADVLGARRAGFTPVLVDREDRHPAADCLRVRELAEIIDLVDAASGERGGR